MTKAKVYVRTGGYASSSDPTSPDYPAVWYRPLLPLFAPRWARGRWVPIRGWKRVPLFVRL